MPQSSPACHSTSSSVHLDAIRGAAALVVLLGHTRDLFFSSLTGSSSLPSLAAKSQYIRHVSPDLPSRVTIGNEAVIIFFVLSGFLVGGSAIKDVANGSWSWKKYLLRRATRLWIVLIPALLFGVAVDFSGLHLFAGGHSIYSCAPDQYLVPCNLAERLSPAVLLGNTFFLQTILVGTAGSNNALWSLANEFWYYLAFPLCLLTVRRGQSISRRLLYLAALAAIGVLVGKQIFLLFFVWLLGAIVSILPMRLPRRPLKWITGFLAPLFPLGFVLVRRAHLPRYLAEWIVAVLFSALLYVVLHRTEPARPGIYRSVAGFFSRMSYTLYLVHLPLAVFLCACINSPWHPWDISLPHLAMFLLLDAVLVCLCYLFYLAFEANTEAIRTFILRSHFSYPVDLHPEKRSPRVIPEVDVSIG